MSKVSIIVPIYNPGIKLERCIKSIINQTFKDIEILLINDGSTDCSIQICNKYLKIDNRIRLINKRNEGVVKARERGIIESRSAYIMFVDSDDWVSVNIVEKLYRNVKEDQYDVVACKVSKAFGKYGLIKLDLNNSLNEFLKYNNIFEYDEIKNKLAKSFLFSGGFPSAMFAKLYRKEVINGKGEYSNKIKFFGEDLYLNFEVFLSCKKIKLTDDTLYYYRRGGGTFSYMPHYFEDLVTGYENKHKIIEKYYGDLTDKEYMDIDINLLESIKACIINLMYSNLDNTKIKSIIKEYSYNLIVNRVAKKMNENNNDEFLNAILYKDIDYIYKLAKREKKKQMKKGILINIIDKIL